MLSIVWPTIWLIPVFFCHTQVRFLLNSLFWVNFTYAHFHLSSIHCDFIMCYQQHFLVLIDFPCAISLIWKHHIALLDAFSFATYCTTHAYFLSDHPLLIAIWGVGIGQKTDILMLEMRSNYSLSISYGVISKIDR